VAVFSLPGVSALPVCKIFLVVDPFFVCRDGDVAGHHPLLEGPWYNDYSGMTLESCAAFCDSQSVSYRFMGITEGTHCGTFPVEGGDTIVLLS